MNKTVTPAPGPIQDKEAEKALSEFFKLAIYATLEDNDQVAEISDDDFRRRDKYTWQYYANLVKISQKGVNKVEVGAVLKNVFNITSEAAQVLRTLFIRMIADLKEIRLAEKDTPDTIVDKITEVVAEPITPYMIQLAHQYDTQIDAGKTLASLDDHSDWICQSIIGQLPREVKDYIPMVVARPFKKFLKALAWIVGKQIWYKSTAASISADFLLSILSMYNFPQVALDEIRSTLREKKPSKPKKAKPAKSVVPEDVSKAVDAAATAETSSEPASAPTQTSSTQAPPINDVDKLAAELLNI